MLVIIHSATIYQIQMLTTNSLCISLYVENTASTINIRYEKIKNIRIVGKIVAEILKQLRKEAKVGVSGRDLEKMAERISSVMSLPMMRESSLRASLRSLVRNSGDRPLLRP